MSDFFPHVVKLVGSSSLEIRKMVYMFLVHYADHNVSCRELALLSINSFQRGLSDSEQWIRALALRVLTSIRVADVLQIQILAVQTCGRDKSPYVRKCAANALAKLYPRCCEEYDKEGSDTSRVPENDRSSRVLDIDQKSRLIELLSDLLANESSTMVLSSALCAFHEMCPQRLEMLHSSYRKICHLLTDMEEWSQIIVLDILSRYCRTFFREPDYENGMGTAEMIDRQRQVVRVVGGTKEQSFKPESVLDEPDRKAPMPLSTKRQVMPQKVKRRVVRKGFYSDEEDESSDEEVYLVENEQKHFSPTLAGAMRQRSVIFGNSSAQTLPTSTLGTNEGPPSGHEGGALDEDHYLLLKSSLPLLKSRNAGVVLAVCSLQYYCGEASIEIRSMMGKALVRIYHDRREIQYVVLRSIKMLVWECPSAFTPFLHDFFVKAMDPSFTRLIKLDILIALSLEPKSINAVLKELRTYIRHDDKNFVCAAIRAVGNITEMAKIVYDREMDRNMHMQARSESNSIALNCLNGLLALTENSDCDVVIGECVQAIERILLLLGSSNDRKEEAVKDPNNVQLMALRKLILFLVRALSSSSVPEVENEKVMEEMDVNPDLAAFDDHIFSLSAEKVTPALWMIGEWLSSSNDGSKPFANLIDDGDKTALVSEVLRLIAKAFVNLEPLSKCHSIHFASKILLTENCSNMNRELCEYILSLGRSDVNQNVRDRGRFESILLHISIGLKPDSEMQRVIANEHKRITPESARSIVLRQKPFSSWLPIEDGITNDVHGGRLNSFRFGTLSSMMSHKTDAMYMPLPPWSDDNSPGSLRDPPQQNLTGKNETNEKKEIDPTNVSNSLYSSSSESSTRSESSDESSESETSSASDSSSDSEEESSSSDDSSSSSSSDESTQLNQGQQVHLKRETEFRHDKVMKPEEDTSSSDEDDESDSSSSSSSTETSSSVGKVSAQIDSKKGDSLIDLDRTNEKKLVSNDLDGLVMTPLVMTKDDAVYDAQNIEEDSSPWKELVRHELSGGLGVSIRFIRGNCRNREAQLLSLDPKDPCTIVLQMKYENRRTDGRSIRRIRLVQRSITHKSAIPTSRVVLPQVIGELKESQLCYEFMALQFQRITDKDDAFMSQFDVKSDRGSNPIVISTPICELLKPVKMTSTEFDSASHKLQGIHQRMSSKLSCVDDQTWKTLPSKVCKVAQLSLVKDDKNKRCFKFVGVLPSSNLDVLVSIIAGSGEKDGELVVCCDDAIASNSILEKLKAIMINA